MPTWKRSHKNQGPKAKARRKGVIARLENQLKEDDKPLSRHNVEPRILSQMLKDRLEVFKDLTLHDKKRIALEIVTLKSRV